MSTPFDPQPLTAVQQQQVVDNASANALIKATLAALAQAKVDFTAIEAQSIKLTHEAQVKPVIDVDVEGLLVQEEKYIKAQDLIRNLGYFLGAVQGWRIGIGQPNHLTFEQLKNQLNQVYLDVAATLKQT